MKKCSHPKMTALFYCLQRGRLSVRIFLSFILVIYSCHLNDVFGN